MSKKIILVVVACFFLKNFASADFYAPQDMSFKKGFDAGLKALEFQKKNEGVQPQKINIHKPYLVQLEITRIPYNEVLFLQNIASREGYKTYLTKNYLIFGEFDREIDAKDAASQLERSFKIKPTIRKVAEKTFLITYPSLWADYWTIFLEEAKNNGFVVKKEIIKITERPKTQQITQRTPPVIAQKPKKILLINKMAMAYALEGDKNYSNSFVEKGLVEKENWIWDNKEKILKTKEGEQFVKVKDNNLFFSIEDVSIGD